MKHAGPKMQHWGDTGKEKWLTREPTQVRRGVWEIHRRWDMGLKLVFQRKKEKTGKDGGIRPFLLSFALLLTRTGGWTSNCTWKRIRNGRVDENLFIYAFNLPKDLSLPHSSDPGGREILRAVLQNKGLLWTTSQCSGEITSCAASPITHAAPPQTLTFGAPRVLRESYHFASLDSKLFAFLAHFPRLYL